MANEIPLYTILVLVTNATTWPEAQDAQQIVASQTSDKRADQQ